MGPGLAVELASTLPPPHEAGCGPIGHTPNARELSGFQSCNSHGTKCLLGVMGRRVDHVAGAAPSSCPECCEFLDGDANEDGFLGEVRQGGCSTSASGRSKLAEIVLDEVEIGRSRTDGVSSVSSFSVCLVLFSLVLFLFLSFLFLTLLLLLINHLTLHFPCVLFLFLFLSPKTFALNPKPQTPKPSAGGSVDEKNLVFVGNATHSKFLKRRSKGATWGGGREGSPARVCPGWGLQVVGPWGAKTLALGGLQGSHNMTSSEAHTRTLGGAWPPPVATTPWRGQHEQSFEAGEGKNAGEDGRTASCHQPCFTSQPSDNCPE